MRRVAASTLGRWSLAAAPSVARQQPAFAAAMMLGSSGSGFRFCTTTQTPPEGGEVEGQKKAGNLEDLKQMEFPPVGGDVKADPDTHPDFQPKPNTQNIGQAEMDEIVRDIEDTIKEDDVVLFMKGLPEAPICGFSRKIVDVLDQMGLEYTSFDVLAHPVVRSHVKKVSKWPTIPQLFVKGEFVGGADIIQDMAASGEFQVLLEKAGIEHRSGKIARRD